MKDDLYERAWKRTYNKFKELTEIKTFHGLQFEDKHMVSLESVIEYMEECLQVASRKEGGVNEISD